MQVVTAYFKSLSTFVEQQVLQKPWVKQYKSYFADRQSQMTRCFNRMHTLKQSLDTAFTNVQDGSIVFMLLLTLARHCDLFFRANEHLLMVSSKLLLCTF